MNLFKLAWKNFKYKKLHSFLGILIMAFGVTIISLIFNISGQIEKKFNKNISGIDMVIGAKGSPLQLILSSVYQIDNPTGNISLPMLNSITNNNSLIKEIIPISMGDNYNGYNIVGTDSNYFSHFNLKLEEGKANNQLFKVVLGSFVAKETGLKVGDKFKGIHGLQSEGEEHESQSYLVTGILENSGLVADRLIFSNLETVWETHHQNGVKEITAAFIKFKSPMGIMTMPKAINQNSTLQAAIPAIELDRLLKLFDDAIFGLKILAGLIIIIAGISIFVSLYSSLSENKYENALLLSLGAERKQLFFILLFEGLIVVLIGYVVGLALSRILLLLITKTLNETLILPLVQPNELILLSFVIVIGFLAALIPALSMYRISISKTLAEE